MNNQKSHVYAVLDEAGCIVQIEGEYSLSNIEDIGKAVLVEEGTPCDRLNHAQHLYLEGPLLSEDKIPLYKWDGQKVQPRTEEEIAADRAPKLRAAKLAELSAACNAAITAGCNVTLSAGSGHIALTAEDQINLSTATAAVEQGAAGYPYHLDGQLCAIYPAADIRAMAAAATAHKLEQTTYYNHLAAWVRRTETAEELAAITYGSALPQDLEDNMAAILGAANNET